VASASSTLRLGDERHGHQLRHAVERSGIIDADAQAADAGSGLEGAHHAQQHRHAGDFQQRPAADDALDRSQRVTLASRTRQHQCFDRRARLQKHPGSGVAETAPGVER
jgi:hypothetical protein